MIRTGYMPLWYSPTYGLMTRGRGSTAEVLTWVFERSGGRVSLRTLLDSGPDSDPPLPEDAVALIPEEPIIEYQITWDGEDREGPLPDSAFPTQGEAERFLARSRFRNLPGVRVEKKIYYRGEA